MQPEPTSHLVRFGVFELDLATGELWKKGAKLILQEQPFQVLAMLVERAGDLVTREDLRARLWPDMMFVDVDQGLNKAVVKVRRSLGDLAASPRYVETLERRGYRFIATVESITPATARLATLDARPNVARLVWGDRTIQLGEGIHVIGRDPTVAVWIDASVVSRRHARIVISAGSVSVEDIGSRNGTLLNGTRVETVTPLAHGDEIRVGPARLIVYTAAGGPTN